MDRLETMRIFTRVVECNSFARAAQDLSLPRSTVTEAVRWLEGRLQTRLLHRTTRHVAATVEGEAYYRHCIHILADVEHAEAAIADGKARGALRVHVDGTLFRHFLAPDLLCFLTSHPDVDLQISEGEEPVELVRQGIDCVLREGKPTDSTLVGRRIGWLKTGTFASPRYLQTFGQPHSIEDLEGHRSVGLVARAGGSRPPLMFLTADGLREAELPTIVTVTTAPMVRTLAKLGFGLAQLPAYAVQAELARGDLIEILTDYPPPAVPLHVLYPQGRQLPPRVRVFIDWVIATFAGKLTPDLAVARA